MRFSIIIAMICLCSCKHRESKIDRRIFDSLADHARRDTSKVKYVATRVHNPDTLPFAFDFVIKEPILTAKDKEGTSWDQSINSEVRIVSDTVNRVLLLYFDRSLKYKFENIKYDNGFEKSIATDKGMVVKIFNSRDRDLLGQIWIHVPEGVIYATGDFDTDALSEIARKIK